MLPFSPGDHPEDLFEAYALGALEEDELADVEAHLEACPRCGSVLASLIETTSLLAVAVPQVAAPPKLLSASLIMNVVTTSRINSLEQERLASNSRIAELEAGQTLVGDQVSYLGQLAAGNDLAMKQVMETNYLMARPFTQPLLLRPTDGASNSEGVLLVNNDGREAILMLSNMDRSRPSQSYQVWLGRNGQQFPIGEIAVDSSGWGTMALKPPESLYGFDWINLTVDEPRTAGGSAGEMVLQTRIISPGDR